jgi:hypothetical protein
MFEMLPALTVIETGRDIGSFDSILWAVASCFMLFTVSEVLPASLEAEAVKNCDMLDGTDVVICLNEVCRFMLDVLNISRNLL